MVTLTPYLNFNGTCEEAMNFYKSVLGGELELTRFKETSIEGHDVNAEGIMHSTLKTPDITFMASDAGMGPVVMGEGVNLALNGESDDSERMHRFFDDLSEGGKVSMSLEKAPWGAEFGAFVDKFGISWMMNISLSKTE